MTPRAVIIGVFAGLVALAVLTELLARRRGSAVYPIGPTVTAAMGTRTGRLVILGFWLWVGWHFLAR
jgi:hypothetical protein